MFRPCALIPGMILFVAHRSDFKDTNTLINSFREKERRIDVTGPNVHLEERRGRYVGFFDSLTPNDL
jgi:hypothetical protein